MISLIQAHAHINMLKPLQPVNVPLLRALGLVSASDAYALFNCPTVDSSLKDGFAVVSSDIAKASPNNPVTLVVRGSLTAGDDNNGFSVTPGTAVRIMTGAALPCGATAVLSSEFAQDVNNFVRITADSKPGKNILCQGSDINQYQRVLAKGELLGPTHLGLLVAAGLKEMSCYPLPKIAIAAVGSELVWPGEPLVEGKVAASNMVTAAAELQALGITASSELLNDDLESLHNHFKNIVPQVDMLITCGGVLDGDKDFTLRAMEQLGMEKIFDRVRIGPGKGACMGWIDKTLVFNLPGGPPSNHMALVLLALSGVRRIMGHMACFPPKRQVFVTENISGQKDWTQLVYSKVKYTEGHLLVEPLSHMRRLEAMAIADGLIEIPEGCTSINKGSLAEAWFIRKRSM